jgi:hypothetical protein
MVVTGAPRGGEIPVKTRVGYVCLLLVVLVSEAVAQLRADSPQWLVENVEEIRGRLDYRVSGASHVVDLRAW